MKHFLYSAVFAISMFLFAFMPLLSRADEKQAQSQQKAAPPEQAMKALTVDDFRAALPERAEELYMEGFLKLKKAGDVVVLDVRSKESFAHRHLKGSVSAPLTDLTEKTLPALSPDKETPVVLVCDYSFHPVRMIAMTMQAYPVLKASGYKNIYRLNLWHDKDGSEMRSDAAQEKLLDFEGTGTE